MPCHRVTQQRLWAPGSKGGAHRAKEIFPRVQRAHAPAARRVDSLRPRGWGYCPALGQRATRRDRMRAAFAQSVRGHWYWLVCTGGHPAPEQTDILHLLHSGSAQESYGVTLSTAGTSVPSDMRALKQRCDAERVFAMHLSWLMCALPTVAPASAVLYCYCTAMLYCYCTAAHVNAVPCCPARWHALLLQKAVNWPLGRHRGSPGAVRLV